MSHRFVVLDRQSVEKLNQLGSLKGDAKIDSKDLSTPDAKKIIKEMPIVTTKNGYGLEIELPSAKDWEKLRTFANTGNGQPVRWARVMFDPKGHIKSIAPAMDHVQCAKDLIHDPVATIDKIRRNLKDHIEQLPVGWDLKKVDGVDSVDVFVDFLTLIRQVESQAHGVNPDAVIDLMGMKPAVIYYETVNVLRMVELFKHGTNAQRVTAHKFLLSMAEGSSTFIRMFNGKDPLTQEKAMKVTHTIYNATMAMFEVTKEARQVLGFLPTLEIHLKPPRTSGPPNTI